MPARSPRHAAFGLAVRELREQQDMAQETFAAECGIDRSHFGGIERGERNASLSMVYRIADTLKVEPSAIFLLAEQKRR